MHGFLPIIPLEELYKITLPASLNDVCPSSRPAWGPGLDFPGPTMFAKDSRMQRCGGKERSPIRADPIGGWLRFDALKRSSGGSCYQSW